MPHYTFHLAPSARGEVETITETLENDEVAVHVARRMLGARRACVRVGRGAGEGVQWIGEWQAGARPAAWTEAG